MNTTFSKIGFILAVAGSAVGLGNAWKFPTMVGQNGGGAFIMLFIALTLAVGFVIFLCELYIGKKSQLDPVGAYYKLASKNKKLWSLVGFTMIGALLIVSFYSVIIGWIVYYIYFSIKTLFSFASFNTDIKQNELIFNNLLSNDLTSVIICFSIVFFMSFYIVSKGVKNGIEKMNVFMMPALFILLLLMLIYSMNIDGFFKACEFLFYPDFSKLNENSILNALGLACFSLSIGAGSIITYSASLPKKTNFISSTLYIVFINLLVGLMMGLIVFSFIFEFGANSNEQGAGLIFISLTSLFAKLGILGSILAILFFIALFFAGITSAVSMIEPFCFFLINRFSFSRKKALILIGFIVYFLGICCILQGRIFDILDYISSNIIMPLGAFFATIFVGYFIKKEDLYAEFSPYLKKSLFELWYFFARVIAPLAVIIIAFFNFYKG
ncbi:sodium-dependent transporter [Campylobacter canadensis]|uniref:Sodium-dependent transporter n=1 Tax=Campylobacter canadensis TaxID=449520 RepID=A0ABS7WUU9_9BACT|nr:sodium-dependent transporter [Campylobacter canadensis]MBZ7987699.1 sodium-dependent transporter [Campylobacter canadensis]MBZ7997528.1 sodium-dependent transporter [Campylobacter canadensis]